MKKKLPKAKKVEKNRVKTLDSDLLRQIAHSLVLHLKATSSDEMTMVLTGATQKGEMKKFEIIVREQK